MERNDTRPTLSEASRRDPCAPMYERIGKIIERLKAEGDKNLKAVESARRSLEDCERVLGVEPNV